MTHATPEEIHDHAYGFRPSDHVAACPACRGAADAVAAERDALKNALDEGPEEAPADFVARLESARPARRRFGAPAVAAAALLLGALTWILFQPKVPVAPTSPAATVTPEEDLQSLVGHLKSPSPLQQELARMAFLKYGGIAIPVLERAGADPVLIDECRGFNDADRAAYRKAQTTRIGFSPQGSPLTAAIEYLRATSDLNFQIVGVPDPETIMVTLNLADTTTLEALERLSLATNIPWGRSAALHPKYAPYRPKDYTPVFYFGAATPAPVSSAPVRVPSDQPWVAGLLRDPESMAPEEVRRRIRDLIPGVHDGLWLLLDSSRPEIRQLAADALRRAYGASPEPSPGALEKELDGRRIQVDFENTPTPDIFLSMFSSQGMAVVLDPRVPIDRRPVTYKVKDLSPRNSLKLLLSQFSLDFIVCDRWVLVTSTDLKLYRQRPPQPLWVAPDEAKRIEGWIADLASDDPSRQLRAKEGARQGGRSGLDWLVHASTATAPPLSSRYLETFRSVAAELGIRLADQAAAAEAQPLTPAQKAIRARPLALRSADKTLENLLQQNGVKARFDAPVPGPVVVAGGDLPVDALLRAVLHPLGLDYFMDGDTVVVDTAAKARAAVERK